MAMASLRGGLRALQASSCRSGALFREARLGGYLHWQQRAAYTESEGKALARVRRLADELNKTVECFPEQLEAPSLSVEFMKLRQHQKYYKNGMWVMVSLYASLCLSGCYAIVQLDRDVADLKEKLRVAQKEVAQLKKVPISASASGGSTSTLASGASTSTTTSAPGPTTSTSTSAPGPTTSTPTSASGPTTST